MNDRTTLRLAILVLAALSMLGSVLFADTATAVSGAASAGTECRTSPAYSEAVHGVLLPSSIPTPDAAIVVGDPDAEKSPMATVRYPDETSLWASSGARGRSLATAAARGGAPTGVLTGLGPERYDRAVSDSIVRLYCGLLGREPTALEVEYWARRYWIGLPLVSIADAFTTSNEFVVRHGDPTDEALIAVLFESVLGRQSGAGGIESYAEALQAGELTRGGLVVAFTDSSEFVAISGTVSPEKPPLPYPAVGSGRRVIYANREARVWFVEATGELAKTHQVSGRRGVPAPGRYNVYSKSRYAWAPYDNVTMEYMVRFAREEWPYGFHSIPIHEDKSPYQTKEQLGTLRSGGCVRQDFDDAEWTFAWTDVGTRVIMTP